MFVPRTELPTAAALIAEIEVFHAVSVESETYDKQLSRLASSTYRISSELTFVIDNLGMNVEPPILKKAFGGIKYDKTNIEASDCEAYVGTLDARAAPIISGLGELIRQRRALEKSRDDNTSLQGTLKAISSFSIDLSQVSSMKRFHVELVILGSEDVLELRKSLPESLVLDAAVS